jgi:hypothetical protein
MGNFPPKPQAHGRLHISLFAMQPFEPSDGCWALRKLMAYDEEKTEGRATCEYN